MCSFFDIPLIDLNAALVVFYTNVNTRNLFIHRMETLFVILLSVCYRWE